MYKRPFVATKQRLLVLVLLLALAGNLIAYFGMQLVMGLEPCPLCILDRVALCVLAVGVASYLMPAGLATRALGICAMLFGFLLGFSSTIRHVWLEHNPESASCLFPSQEGGALSYVLDAFAGTSDCSQVTFRLLGLSLAEMTLLFFVVLAGLAVFAFMTKTHQG